MRIREKIYKALKYGGAIINGTCSHFGVFSCRIALRHQLLGFYVIKNISYIQCSITSICLFIDTCCLIESTYTIFHLNNLHRWTFRQFSDFTLTNNSGMNLYTWSFIHIECSGLISRSKLLGQSPTILVLKLLSKRIIPILKQK